MKYIYGHILTLVTVALLLASCAGESYPGMEYEYVLNEDIINDESGKTNDRGVMIEVYLAPDTYTMGSVSTTRGTGPFIVPDTTRQDSNRYEHSTFHVFAFRASPDDQGTLEYSPDYTKRSNDLEDGKVNCLVDGNNYNLGAPSRLDVNRSGKLHFKRYDMLNDSLLYYSAKYNDVGYNFFAYHLDDFVPTEATTHRTAEGICYDIDIDGTRDLVYGYAPKLTSAVLDSLIVKDNLEIDAENRNHILNIGYYSSYAAYHGVRPYVSLKHALTRLRFMAFPADQTCDSVTIEGIEILAHNKAHLWVARPNAGEVGLTFEPERAYVQLMDHNATTHPDSIGSLPYEPLRTEGNTVNWKPEYAGKDWKENPPTIIGGDMLVPTDSVFRMKLYYKQTLRNIDPKTGQNIENHNSATYDLRAPEIDVSYDERLRRYMYLPGHTYHINIGIYGLRPILVNTELEGWEEGEDIPPIDEFEITY